MKLSTLFLSVACLFIACYFPMQYTYRVDLKAGTVEVTYHDLRSDEDVDSSVVRDWQDLKKSIEYRDSIFESPYYSVESIRLFPEDSVLSGNFRYRVSRRDSAFSLLGLLKSITGSEQDDNVSWHATNKELFLFVDTGADYNLLTSNGKQFNTEHAAIARWSINDSLFTFTFGIDTCCPGTSLLSNYSADKAFQKKLKLQK